MRKMRIDRRGVSVGKYGHLESLERRCVLAASPLVISEFLASNDNVLDDGDGNSSDWIEVHNPTATAVELDGWFLSDDQTELDKWPFPNVAISPGDYLIVFASGKSTVDYVDAGDSFHTNFKLSRGGEFLGLSYSDPAAGLTVVHQYAPEFPPQYEDVSYGLGKAVETTTLIAEGADARLLVPTNNSVDDVWTETNFDDASWRLGRTGIGYENSPADYAGLILTNVPRGTDAAYVRMEFNVEDAASLDSLTLRMKYDDGFVAYLNGAPTAVARRNAPGNLNFSSVAAGNHEDADAVQFVDFDITRSLGLLNDGPNVLAIHALNQATSSDMLMLPELVTTRQSNGSQTTGYFATPTPGRANSTGIVNPGPVIREVTQNPVVTADDDLVVTAGVTALESPIGNVALQYRVMYDTMVTIPMVDDGSGNDQLAGDGIFTAVIPASVAEPGEMLRWFVTAEDAGGLDSRAPAFLDSAGNGQSSEYFGTVVEDPSFDSALPVFRWFTQNESASHRRTGTRASVSYAGRFL